jgi:uncharacterized membrane protein YozB (DUF420 family)
MDSFLSNAPDARLASDVTLLFFLVILVPAMLLGFSFARRKMFRPQHKYTMTAITAVIWLFIVFLMIVSYRTWVAPAELGGPFSGDPAHIIPTVHLITGGIAQILATYLLILMWTEKSRLSWVVPRFLRTTHIKPIMRTTLTLWLVAVALGVGIFLTWYAPGSAPAAPPEATEAPDVAATEEVEAAETEAAEVEPVETEEAEGAD